VIVGVEQGAAILREGGVIAYPTETVYGLGADASREPAVHRLCELKGCEASRGFSVLVSGVEEFLRWAPDAPPPARRLARRFWPGPLTVVVPVRGHVLAPVSTRLGIGFRCSSHPTSTALLEHAGRPIVSTSCNRTGREPCVTAEEVTACFGAALPVAGGEPAGGQPSSTVVAVSAEGELELLRQGATSFAEVCSEAHL
jgi:L-threonylcarbamoyladenylate synthase